jgi:hypothetical protein
MKMMISLISNYFLYERKPGISHKIIDEKLTITINTTINTIINDPGPDKSFFKIGYNNDNFCIQKLSLYTQFHTKISNAFPGINYKYKYTVILRE